MQTTEADLIGGERQILGTFRRVVPQHSREIADAARELAEQNGAAERTRQQAEAKWASAYQERQAAVAAAKQAADAQANARFENERTAAAATQNEKETEAAADYESTLAAARTTASEAQAQAKAGGNADKNSAEAWSQEQRSRADERLSQLRKSTARIREQGRLLLAEHDEDQLWSKSLEQAQASRSAGPSASAPSTELESVLVKSNDTVQHVAQQIPSSVSSILRLTSTTVFAGVGTVVGLGLFLRWMTRRFSEPSDSGSAVLVALALFFLSIALPQILRLMARVALLQRIGQSYLPVAQARVQGEAAHKNWHTQSEHERQLRLDTAAGQQRQREREASEAEARAADEALTTRNRRVEEARFECEARMAAATEERDRRLEDARRSYEANSTAAALERDQRHENARREFEASTAAATACHEETVAGIDAAFRQHLDEIAAAVEQIDEQADRFSPAWSHETWKLWRTAESAPPVVRLGALSTQCDDHKLFLPALLPLPGDRPVLFEAGGDAKATAVDAMQSLLLRMLAAIPGGKLIFTFIDPVGLGQNAAPFMHLTEYKESLVTNRAWTEPQHIEQRLADITEHMENVIQKYLRNDFATIEEYNLKAEVPEPYLILVLFDFPVNFSEAAARRLLSIATNGPRCGVYTCALIDPDRTPPRGFEVADLERVSTVIAWETAQPRWRDPDFGDCELELDAPPKPDLFNSIVRAVGDASLQIAAVQVPFERIAPPEDQWWTASSQDGLKVSLGPTGARLRQYLELGSSTSQHALLVGRTGSGKSTLLHALITNAALTYSPDELELYLLDFKEGVEFKTYALHQLPHARVIAIESEREFGLSVLGGLEAELERRGALFREASAVHGDVPDLPTYRRKTGRRLPRILLVADEFQLLFAEDDRLATRVSQVIDRLVRQGRAFGIHLVLASQSLAGAFGSYGLPRATLDQMAVRIALQCTETDSRLILADDNPAARRLSRPGEAIYNAANGIVEGNHFFQVAWLSDEQRDSYLQRVRRLADQTGAEEGLSRIVFEGNVPASLEHDRGFNELVSESQWRSNSSASAWFGEAVAMKPPIAASFRRQTASNLLLVGQDGEVAYSLMVAGLLSLASTLHPGAAEFFVIDLAPTDIRLSGALTRVGATLPHRATTAGRADITPLILQLGAEVTRRMDSDASGSPSLFLFIYGLQRARDLRIQDEPFSMSLSRQEATPPSASKVFSTILREGPAVGVHTLTVCDTFVNLDRMIGRRSLREFDLRVALQMAPQDSNALLDSPLAGSLGPNRALLYSEEEGRLDKFRPYGSVTDAWAVAVAQTLAARQSPTATRATTAALSNPRIGA